MNVLTCEQLKQQLDAVVAECADMKNAHAAVLEHISVTDKGPAGTAAMIANDALYNTATPNVTAALAEVDAKAIEKHIASLKKMLAELDPEIFAYGQVKAALESAMFWAEKFAVELREGRV